MVRHFALFVVLASCSSPPKSPETEDTTGAATDATGTTPRTSTSSNQAGSSESSLATGMATDRELTHGDCRVLGDKFRSLTISDNQKFVKPDLDPDARAQGEKSIADAANKLSSRWTDSCENSLVGKFAPEESLKCAMGAKTVAAFDACLNAPATPPK